MWYIICTCTLDALRFIRDSSHGFTIRSAYPPIHAPNHPPTQARGGTDGASLFRATFGCFVGAILASKRDASQRPLGCAEQGLGHALAPQFRPGAAPRRRPKRRLHHMLTVPQVQYSRGSQTLSRAKSYNSCRSACPTRSCMHSAGTSARRSACFTARLKCPCSRQPMWPTTAPEARPLAHGCPADPRREPSSLGC